MHTAPPTLDFATPAPRTWSVGTLTYDRRGLVMVFFWLLWGDFVLTLMDGGVVANVVQVQLKNMGASNAAIGFLSGTVTALMSAVGVALISTASDRHRGPRGRRIPFMLWSAPPLALTLIGVGFSGQIARFLEHSLPQFSHFFGRVAANVLPGASTLPASVHLVLAVMTTLLILYRVFDLFPGTVYYCLWADVVPAKLIGAFACCFRIVGALGMFVFNRYLLRYADTHPEYLYIGAGLLYLVSFTVMCLAIREGEYPPPEDRVPGHGVVPRTIEYFKMGYSRAFWWKFYVMTAGFIIAVKSLNQFVILFGKQSIGLDAGQVGTILSYKDLLTLVPFLLLAPIIDRFHPLRAGLVAIGCVLVCGAASFFLIHDRLTFALCINATFIATALYQASTGAINVRLLPRDRFGQFNSANVMVWQLSWAAAAVLCGRFLDWVQDYRYLMLWFSVFVAISLVAMIFVYRDWKKLGGDAGYVAPVPGGERAGYDVLPPVKP